MFENFPYTDMHQLNLDWIIKIAKDFLDQYTHIQELIEQGKVDIEALTESGLSQLDDKADALEAALQAWYNEHSTDIANQLAQALADMNAELQRVITAFDASAEAKGALVLDSIPDDYTSFFNSALKDCGNIVYANNYTTILSDANNAVQNTIYRMAFTVGDTSIPANLPSASWRSTTPAILVCIATPNDAVQKVQILFESDYISIRNYTSSWQSWKAITFNPALDTRIVRSAPTVITDNVSISDLDDITTNSVYRLNFVVGATSIPAHCPTGSAWTSTTTATLITTRNDNILASTQIFICSDGVYSRTHGSVGWNQWVMVAANPTDYIKNYPKVITGISDISDLDDITYNSVYRLNFVVGATSIPAHCPTGSAWTSTTTATLITTMSNNLVASTQIFICSDGVYSRPHGSVAWNQWVKVADPYSRKEITVDASGAGDYTSLTQALLDVQGDWEVTVFVKAGLYNIIDEIDAIYGSNYLDNLTESWIGPIVLQNHIRVVFSEGAIVRCMYRGSNIYTRQRFSIFNAGQHGFTLENARIQGWNIRYCVHDEHIEDATAYQNYYLNCEMYKDNTANTDFTNPQCIGGGLGKYGQIIIKDCLFDNGANSGYWVSYHNSSASTARSKIVVSGCYFTKQGFLRLAYYGTTTEQTQCFVSDNSFGAAVQVAPETHQSVVQNRTLYDFNNTIR